MIQVKCNQDGHYESPVQALCLRIECQNNSAYCLRCVQLHPDCAHYLKFLEEVPKATSELQTTRDQFRDAFKLIIKQISQVEQIVSQHFLPIEEYNSNPTLTNLNKLGKLLKEQKPIDLKGLEKWTKSISMILDQCQDILLNKNIEPIKYEYVQPAKQMNQILQLNDDRDFAQKYLWEVGEKLYNNKQYQAAIICYDKAIEIDQDDVDSIFKKGYSLYWLKQNSKAIECFNKCIQIDPKQQQAYYVKGRSLQRLNQDEEAIKCFNEQNQIKPNLWSYEGKGKILEKLLRLKDAEKCYIEALKHFPEDDLLENCLKEVQLKLKKKK